MEDFNAYKGLLSEMRSLVDLLEEKYGRRLPGSPPLADALIDFYDSNPDDTQFQKAKELADEFVNLNLAISSDPERYEAFMTKMR